MAHSHPPQAPPRSAVHAGGPSATTRGRGRGTHLRWQHKRTARDRVRGGMPAAISSKTHLFCLFPHSAVKKISTRPRRAPSARRARVVVGLRYGTEPIALGHRVLPRAGGLVVSPVLLTSPVSFSPVCSPPVALATFGPRAGITGRRRSQHQPGSNRQTEGVRHWSLGARRWCTYVCPADFCLLVLNLESSTLYYLIPVRRHRNSAARGHVAVCSRAKLVRPVFGARVCAFACAGCRPAKSGVGCAGRIDICLRLRRRHCPPEPIQFGQSLSSQPNRQQPNALQQQSSIV